MPSPLKKITLLASMFLGISALPAFAAPRPVLLECEDMEFKAAWTRTTTSAASASGGASMLAPDSNSDALTVIVVP
ncbi:MAG: hypothetical protein LBC18_09460, partial [Opitutaceae bacterium]|nr:hypothetical protein [Opitutaceae bacterium]